MTLEAEGAYIRLLAYNWQDGSIPSSIEQLAPMCKTTVRRMATLWDCYLKQCFVENPLSPGTLVNERLERVRKDLLAFIEEKREAGKRGGIKSGAVRREAKSKAPSFLLEAKAKQNEALQSPVSSLQIGKEEKPSLRSGKKKCPENMPITDEHWKWARQHHVTIDLEAETLAMQDWAKANGALKFDWEATRRNWWRKAQKDLKYRPLLPDIPQRTSFRLTDEELEAQREKERQRMCGAKT